MTSNTMTVKSVEGTLKAMNEYLIDFNKMHRALPKQKQFEEGVLIGIENAIKELDLEIKNHGLDIKSTTIRLAKATNPFNECTVTALLKKIAEQCYDAGCTHLPADSKNTIVNGILKIMLGTGKPNSITPLVDFAITKVVATKAKEQRSVARKAAKLADKDPIGQIISDLFKQVEDGKVSSREEAMRQIAKASLELAKKLGLEVEEGIEDLNDESLGKFIDELFEGNMDKADIKAACQNLFGVDTSSGKVNLPGGIQIDLNAIQNGISQKEQQMSYAPGQQVMVPTPNGYMPAVIGPDGRPYPMPTGPFPQTPPQVEPAVRDYSVQPAPPSSAEPIKAPVKEVKPFQVEVVDVMEQPGRAPEIPVDNTPKEKPITIKPEVVEAPHPEVVAELPHEPDPRKFDNSIMIREYPYLADIEGIALAKGHQVAFAKILNINGKDMRLVQCQTYDKTGTQPNIFKSFTIDNGCIIDRRQKVYPLLPMNTGFEEHQAYPVFKYTQKSRKINSDLFEKLFTAGFDLLDNRDGLYSKELLDLNRKVALISMPTKGMSGDVTTNIRNALLKANKKGMFEEIARDVGGPVRFVILRADKTGQFEMTSAGVSMAYNSHVYSNANVSIKYVLTNGKGKFDVQYSKKQ